MSGETTPPKQRPASGEISPGAFRIPSPYFHRRQRTVSLCEAVAQQPSVHGVIKSFCRQKGHGFITPVDGGEDLFVHISDIEDQYVPVEGDEVTFKKTLVPPKNEKYQAMHVKIVHLKEGTVHQRWDSPPLH